MLAESPTELAVEVQVVGGVHRVDGNRPDMVYRLVAAGTIEERASDRRATKRLLVMRSGAIARKIKRLRRKIHAPPPTQPTTDSATRARVRYRLEHHCDRALTHRKMRR